MSENDFDADQQGDKTEEELELEAAGSDPEKLKALASKLVLASNATTNSRVRAEQLETTHAGVESVRAMHTVGKCASHGASRDYVTRPV